MSAGPEEIANAASFYLAGVNIDASLKKEFPSLGVVPDEDETAKAYSKHCTDSAVKRRHTSWGNCRGSRGIQRARSESLEDPLVVCLLVCFKKKRTTKFRLILGIWRHSRPVPLLVATTKEPFRVRQEALRPLQAIVVHFVLQ